MEGIEKIELKDIEIASQLNLRIKLLGILKLLMVVYLKLSTHVL